ncbi:hypothetical protein P43SY_009203 [Pythium insidiosum]|uniref:Mitochondrial inner membrane protease subunit n=1 Tax=Pythium insidiosum TaxID=114742 RepID=A0AAD5QE95_PYTIN|nr:hypothetical protein P43SY_009203 [Pythium insidiosum]
MEQVAGDEFMTETAGNEGAALAGARAKPSTLSRAAMTSVLQYWKAFDLDSKRVVLDTQGTTMRTEKDNSLRSRKKLAETTKTFRKLPDADKIAGMGGLLRAYQEEIDSLTRRAKYSENAFFMLYKGLYAAPDPVPSLEAMQDVSPKLAELEDDNKRLKRELHEYEVEFSSLKNQEITIRRLEDQLSKMEHDMEEVIHEKTAEKCKDLEEQLAVKSSELVQQKLDYERQLQNGRAELREAFNRMDTLQSELFAVKQRTDFAKSTLDAEMEMITQEALAMQTLKLENSQLKKQIDELLSVSGDSNVSSVVGTSSTFGPTTELSQKEATITSLRQEVFRLKETVTQLEDKATTDRTKFEDLLQQAKRAQDDLTAQLAARPTMEKYNDILHQLRVLQQLEYNIVDDEENLTSPGGSSSETDASQASTEIEKILVARVRRLEHALQQSDLHLQKRTSELENAKEELTRKISTIEEQTTLLRTLEDTVASLESRRALGTAVSRSDVTADILMDAVEDQNTERRGSENARAGGSAHGGSADSKMFEIVRGQRDRFRDRMKELQTEKNKTEELANSLRSQVTRLEQDNMQLYQKIRYLQSYRGAKAQGSGTRGGHHRVAPGSLDLEGGSESTSDVEARYKSMYEEKMNPFQQFNKMESQQRYTNLNTVDKILLNSARLFLGHRITRNIAFAYILLLHFLVVATLYTNPTMKPWQVVAKAALWLPVGVAVNSLVVSVASVKGRSMQPALNDGVTNGYAVRDRVLLDKFSIQIRHRYRRGDVVVLTSPEDPNGKLVKRLVALEGDIIQGRDGHSIVIPQGKCWVEGDNNALSDDDSNKFGPVPLALLDSRVAAVVWPLDRMKLVERKMPENRSIV